MEKDKIRKGILIEELVDNYPFSVNYLSKKGIRCIACGEAIWGTLEEASKEKGLSDDDIEEIVDELIKLNETFEKEVSDNIKKIDIDKLNV